MRSDVSFEVDGERCVAWHYAGDGSGTCVVIGHGFSLTRHDGLDPLARRFAAEGHDALVFDHRFWGDSGGLPRGRTDPRAMLSDWLAAIAFARGLPEVERIVLWGYSLGGGNAVRAAAADGNIAAVLTLCPMADGPTQLLMPPRLIALRLAVRAVADAAGRGGEVPVAGRPGEVAVMTSPDDAPGFAAVIGPGSSWRNAMRPAGMLLLPINRPVRAVRRVTCPLWIGCADGERSVSRPAQLRLARLAPRGELHTFAGHHFSALSAPGVIEEQVGFLRRHGV